MIVSDINEISIIGVYDRGKPNQERIALYAREATDLGQYGLMIGIRAASGMAFPIKDNLLWFGDALLKQGDWVFVYTGPGEPKAIELPNAQAHLYSIHWGRKETILHHPDLVPILFRVDAVHIPIEAPLLPSPQQKQA